MTTEVEVSLSNLVRQIYKTLQMVFGVLFSKDRQLQLIIVLAIMIVMLLSNIKWSILFIGLILLYTVVAISSNQTIVQIMKSITVPQIKAELPDHLKSHTFGWLVSLLVGLAILSSIGFVIAPESNSSRIQKAFAESNWYDVDRFYDKVWFPSDEIKSKHAVAVNNLRFIHAKELYSDGKVKEAIRLAELCDLPEAQAFTADVNFKVHSIDNYVQLLKTEVHSDSNSSRIIPVLEALGTISDYQNIVKDYYPFGEEILTVHKQVSDKLSKYDNQLNGLKSELDFIKSSLESHNTILSDLKKQGIGNHRFTIIGVVTTAHAEENGEKTLEASANLALLDNYKTVALVDNEEHKLPNGNYLKTYSFTVKPLGSKYFLRTGAYGWYRVGQGDAYQIVSNEENPIEVSRNIKNISQRKDSISKVISLQNVKLEKDVQYLLPEIISTLRKSFN